MAKKKRTSKGYLPKAIYDELTSAGKELHIKRLKSYKNKAKKVTAQNKLGDIIARKVVSKLKAKKKSVRRRRN